MGKGAEFLASQSAIPDLDEFCMGRGKYTSIMLITVTSAPLHQSGLFPKNEIILMVRKMNSSVKKSNIHDKEETLEEAIVT